MSTIPSLALIPSGYKASKVYSVLPTDGSGDLTFTRALDTATRVRPDGLIEGVGANVPRLDYLGGGCPKLLLEPQRTNLITFSEQFDNAAWAKGGATISPNSAVSPDGFMSADKIIASATLGDHLIFQIPAVSIGVQHSYSFFAKAAGYNFIRIADGDGNGAFFNLANGTIVGSLAANPKIESFGNGWYRCSFTALTSGTGTFVGLLISENGTTTNFLGDGISGVFVYGCQLEAGSYVSSYIPTLGAAVTRSADAASKTGISALIGQTEGTIYGEFANPAQAANGRYFSLSDGTAGDRIDVYAASPTSIGIFAAKSFGVIINTTFAVPANAPLKYAIAYKAGDYAWYLNGVQIGTSVDTNVPIMSVALLATDPGGGIAAEGNPAAQALLFPTRLTNAQLAELTA